jgi:hypothetical protein
MTPAIMSNNKLLFEDIIYIFRIDKFIWIKYFYKKYIFK